MKNLVFEETEDIVNILAPSNVTAGDLVQLGRIRGVAVTTQLSGEPVALKVRGTFDILKAGSEAFASAGLPVYCAVASDGVKTATTVNGTTNVLIGVSMAVSAASPGTVRTRLLPSAANVFATTVA